MFLVKRVSQLCVQSPPTITPYNREYAVHKKGVLQNTFVR